MSKRRERAKVDLEAMVCAGESSAYEALELYKSKASRFKLKNDVEQAVDVLSKASVVMIAHGYYTCADELCCNQLMQLLNESCKELTIDLRGSINSIDNAFAGSGHEIRHKFLGECVKWSAAIGDRKYGDPLLQTQLGSCLWAMGEQRRALRHFAAGEAPDKLWSLIQNDLVISSADKELESVTALSILHFLSLENLRDANELWGKYMQSLEGSGNVSKLGEFVVFLLKVCERDAGPLFKKLCERYNAYLSFDSAALTLLQGPIGMELFNIQPTSNTGGLMSLFQSFMGGSDNNGLFL